MDKSQLILGLGELIYDHIFLDIDGQLYYNCSRGGGSVFNLLANVVYFGGTAAAIGVGGKDSFGEAALMELQHLGVDTSYLSLLPGRTTRVIFETICQESGRLWKESKHTFSTKCPVCGSNQLENTLARIRSQDTASLKNYHDVSFACFDRLTQERLEAARECSEYGIKTVLDIGRIGFLRYFPATYVAAALKSFDIVLIPESVAASLTRRVTGLTSEKDLGEVGPRLLMYVSKGPKGMAVYDTRDGSKIKGDLLPPTAVNDILDDAGAGDAFLARVLWELAKHQSSDRRLEDYELNTLLQVTTNAITELEPVLRVYGARGHIEVKENLYTMGWAEWKGLSVKQIQSSLVQDSPCQFCGVVFPRAPQTSKKTPQKVGAKRNISWLSNRTLLATERKEAIEQCRQLLRTEGTAYTVGTGGSYSVAVFLSLLLNKHGKLFTQPIRPFDYIRTARSSDYVFVISYSGSTADCEDVIIRASEIGVSRIILLTGAVIPKLNASLRSQDFFISYERPKAESNYSPRERGFVSIAGTVAPCALWTAAVTNPLEMMELARELKINKDIELLTQVESLVKAARNDQTIPAFGGGLAWPAMQDLESKFVEGDLGVIQLHEVKDFSHGRFITVMGPKQKHTPILFFSVGELHAYEKFLLRTLQADHTVIPISSNKTGILGALDLLVRVQFLAHAIGEALGKDISRPSPIPDAGLKLYRWRRGLE